MKFDGGIVAPHIDTNIAPSNSVILDAQSVHGHNRPAVVVCNDAGLRRLGFSDRYVDGVADDGHVAAARDRDGSAHRMSCGVAFDQHVTALVFKMNGVAPACSRVGAVQHHIVSHDEPVHSRYGDAELRKRVDVIALNDVRHLSPNQRVRVGAVQQSV